MSHFQSQRSTPNSQPISRHTLSQVLSGFRQSFVWGAGNSALQRHETIKADFLQCGETALEVGVPLAGKQAVAVSQVDVSEPFAALSDGVWD
jgi:hypothetical protein